MPQKCLCCHIFALIIGHDWARLLQPLAQSLTGSPVSCWGVAYTFMLFGASEIMMHDVVIIIYSPQKLKGENSIVQKLSNDVAEFGNTDRWFDVGTNILYQLPQFFEIFTY